MPRLLRMPSEAQLPPGPHRDLVRHLFTLYARAGRPSLTRISSQILKKPDLPGTASKETVRRILAGDTFSRWENIEAIILVLCEMAGEDPDKLIGDEPFDSPEPRRAWLRDLWNNAIDNPPPPQWSPHSDEPPF